ncbi:MULTISPECIES: S1C family serine protease [Rosistilla]|uniref:Putative periplasmic serine endoprotease DegP-like n=2 Tax=Rosistilla TaxID=2795779 RepID=A0A517LUT8_9BACT|nr:MULTISPECIES: trypsin-like peptidase domain-containing protein [Rosistilla]QDS86394.1 putative periplasmic serine endoprotease DegP-like precursor [Rosistilla ulvae]QDV66747.1 putative periplasmic serine endoprotease DegP-like precursor [Rosistilla carotiformis]
MNHLDFDVEPAEYSRPADAWPQSTPSPKPPKEIPPLRNQSSSPGAAQALVSLVMLGVLLLATRFLVPTLVEEIRYAWHRGELRAEYESSGEGLRNVSMNSLAQAYQMVTQRVGPSVVHIDVERDLTEQERELAVAIRRGSGMELPGDQGSGVIVDDQGFVLTNYHVIEGGSDIHVGLSDGRRVSAEVVGMDALTDIAILKIEANGLLPVRWGDSDKSEVGTPVWAVGSPFGLDRTVTFGILSGKHRATKAGTRYQDFMQSDVAVNPGNSGGPLINSAGELIGINTAIVGETYRGVSFSIPSNVAKQVYERLRSSGYVNRGWLGVALDEVPESRRHGDDPLIRGALVRGLANGSSPARNAGILPDDIIIAFNSQPVRDMGALMRMVGDTTGGSTVSMEIYRGDSTRLLDVEIGMRPDDLKR